MKDLLIYATAAMVGVLAVSGMLVFVANHQIP